MFDYHRPIYRKLLVLINVFVIIVYLSVCLVPFINTGIYWLVALAGLGFPLLLLVLLLFILLWAVLKSKWLWVTLVAVVLGFQQIIAVFSFHFQKEFSLQKEPGILRVMHWNLQNWGNEYDKTEKGRSTFVPYMMDLIHVNDADVLCFSEYADVGNKETIYPHASELTKSGYPYHLFAPTDTSYTDIAQGVAIFSKYPIVHSDVFNYGEYANAEHLIYVDINTGKDTFRVFTTHLQSVHFDGSDYRSLDRLRRARDPGYHDSRNVVSKLKNGYWYRYLQAQLVKQKIRESPYPVILTGDFNDVPSSNTYFTIKSNLQDAFLTKGSWIGRTFRYISPTLRIDYILADQKFKVTQFEVIHVNYSDHYPIITDLRYKDH
ncbi:MAG: endonuclease/exonuclease/phosphatase family protein [Ginsengibacter sp.]